MTQIKTHLLFPSPVFECKIDNYKEINLELEKYIHELKKNSKGIKASNAGNGWHSPYFLISEVDILKKFVKKFFHLSIKLQQSIMPGIVHLKKLELMVCGQLLMIKTPIMLDIFTLIVI